MNKIELEGMKFYAHHGCYREEQKTGTYFLVDLTIEGDLNKAAQSDNINDAVNYQKAYNFIKQEMQQTSHLLEHVAGRINKRLMQEMPEIEKVTIKVSKLNPPMGGQIEKVSVTISDINQFRVQ